MNAKKKINDFNSRTLQIVIYNKKTRKWLRKTRDNQMEKLLENYSSEEMKQKYETEKKHIEQQIEQVNAICIGVLSAIFWWIFSFSISLGISVVNVIVMSGLFTLIEKKMVSQLKSGKQIEELAKLEFFQENEEKINEYIKTFIEVAVQNIKETEKLSEEERKKVCNQIWESTKFTIHDLDPFSLEQLQQFVEVYECEQQSDVESIVDEKDQVPKLQEGIIEQGISENENLVYQLIEEFSIEQLLALKEAIIEENKHTKTYQKRK